MKFDDRMKELLAEHAKENIEKQLESVRNPLSLYSTSQLKAELKRRKENERKPSILDLLEK